uniref:Uncharacterized protein n=1 Tax=Anguilla anguilla TaxID=7936 RepID=A0A0E9WLR6_ANGAN
MLCNNLSKGLLELREKQMSKNIAWASFINQKPSIRKHLPCCLCLLKQLPALQKSLSYQVV